MRFGAAVRMLVVGLLTCVAGAWLPSAVVTPAGASTSPNGYITSSSGSFAEVAVGDVGSKVLVVTNPMPYQVDGSVRLRSGAPFSIAPSSTCGSSLQAHQSCRVTVLFSPSARGSYAGALDLLLNGIVLVDSAPLSGQGIAPYVITPSSSAWSFGNWTVGSTSPTKTFTVTNRHATASGTISSVSVANPDFTITGGTCAAAVVIPAKGTCTVQAAFTPKASDPTNVSANLTVAFAGEPPASVALNGQKVTAVSLTPSPVSFGTVGVGVLASKVVTVTSRASYPVPLQTPALSAPGEYSIGSTTCPTTLAPASSCTVTVRLTPTSVGSKYAKLFVGFTDNGATQTAAINLSATAAAVCPTLDPDTGALSPAPAPGVDWHRCDLRGADLSNANLSGANLSSANLTGVVGYDVDLSGANLVNTKMAGAHLAGANLSSANLSSADVDRADLADADLSGSIGPGNTTQAFAIYSSGTVCSDGNPASATHDSCVGVGAGW